MSDTAPKNIRDVARMAGVSTATVSRVINNSSSVSEAARAKVLNVIRSTGFVVSSAARNLKMSQTNLVGLIVPTLNNPFYLDFFNGISDTAKEKNYGVVLVQRIEEPSKVQDSIFHLNSLNVDGIIDSMPEHMIDDAVLDSYKSLSDRIPITRTAEFISSQNIDIVCNDNKQVGLLVGNHLGQMGHEKIAVIASQFPPSIVRRIEGFKEALINLGIPLTNVKFFDGDFSLNSGYQQGLKIIDDPTDFSAVFALNDIMAIGFYQAAAERGIRIPEDISIVGVDGIIWGSLVTPRLTTVNLAAYEMGVQAFTLLHERISGTYTDKPRKNIVRGRLTVRDSSTPSVSM